MATEQQDLRTEVKELRLAVTGLVTLLDEKVQTKVEKEVKAKSIGREEYARRVRASGKRVIAGAVLLLALLVLAVGWNRVTLTQAQRDLNNQVVTCFLRPGAITPAQSAACGRRFGPEYARLQQRSAAANARFTSLQEWAKQRGWEPPSERKP